MGLFVYFSKESYAQSRRSGKPPSDEGGGKNLFD